MIKFPFKSILIVAIILFINISGFSQSPNAGSYPNTSINIGENKVIQPTATPSGYDYLSLTSATFPIRGMVIDQQSGAIRLTNPQLPGSHTIYVNAVSSGVTAVSEFEVLVYRELAPELCDPMYTEFTSLAEDSTTHFSFGIQNFEVLDFNNDNYQDFITQDRESRLELYLGQGDGGFQFVDLEISTNYYNSFGENSINRRVADLNNDGNPDILALSRRGSDYNTSHLVSFLGDGINSLSPQADSIFIDRRPNDTTWVLSHNFALHDLNSDGNLDLVIAESQQIQYTTVFNIITRANIRLFLGNGDGSFTPWQEVMLEGDRNDTSSTSQYIEYITDIKFADFDEDGDKDIALSAKDPGITFLLLEDFGELPLKEIPTKRLRLGWAASKYSNIEFADINHDDHLDIMFRQNVVFENYETMYAYLGDGNLNFTYSHSIGNLTAGGEDFFKLADINQDNELDIVLSDYTYLGYYDNNSQYLGELKVAYGNLNGIFSEFQTLFTIDGIIQDFAIGDFNQDKGSDVLARHITPLSSGKERLSNNLHLYNNTFIEVSGKTTPIATGDETPDVSDGTAFGAVGQNSSLTRSFSISNTGTVPIIIHKDSIYLENDSNAFSIVDSVFRDSSFHEVFPIYVMPGTSESISISFSPEVLGPQVNTLHIKTTSCNIKDYYFSLSAMAVVPSLGIYEATTMDVGSSSTVAPSGGVPYSAIYAMAPSQFDGVLSVDRNSGMLSITNPVLPGNYDIKIYAFDEIVDYEDLGLVVPALTKVRTLVPADSTTFQLSVLPQECSDGFFSSGDSVYTHINSHGIQIGDFNMDGIQDLINAYAVDIPFPDPNDFPALPDLEGASVRLGNGDGSFTGPGFLSETDSLLELIAGFSPRSVAIGDYDGNGSHDIAVANSDPVGNIFIRSGLGNGLFLLPELPTGVVPLVGGYSKAVKTADFNNDGFLDLAVANYGLSVFPYLSSVSVLLGDGMLGFQPSDQQFVGNGSGDLVIGDFNNDGNPDYATASFLENKISIRIGDGEGLFSKGNDVSAFIGYNPSSIAMGDFNSDGNLDLVTTSDQQNTISVKLGLGDGTFYNDRDRSYPTGQNPSDVSVADFNGDGQLDLAVANKNDNTVSIYLGDGQGEFYINQVVSTALKPVSMDVGDINNDGFLDLAVSANQSGFVHILYGDEPLIGSFNASGNGQTIVSGSSEAGFENHTFFDTLAIDRIGTRIYTFTNTAAVPIVLDESSVSVSGSDMELFSIANMNFPLIVESMASFDIEVSFAPLTIGTKTAIINIDNVVCEEAVHYLDFNIEGTAVLPATLGMYPNTESLTGGEAIIIPDEAPGLTTRMTAISESNLFGGILTVDPVTGEVLVSNANIPGTYTINVHAFNQHNISTISSFELTVPDQACSIGTFEMSNYKLGTPGIKANDLAIGDLNMDGYLDMVVLSGIDGSAASNTQQVYLGTEEASVYTILERSEDNLASEPKLVDLNGDGIMDLVLLYPDTKLVSIELGAGDGTFSPHGAYASGNSPRSMIKGDINEDGNMDFLVYNKNVDNCITILTGDGMGSFSSLASPAISGAGNIHLGDFNTDGHLDLLAFMADHLALLPGDGSGSFAEAVSSSIYAVNSPFSFFQTSKIYSTAADFNGDQIPDIAYSNDEQAWIHLGNGDGSFDRGSRFSSSNGYDGMLNGDFNGDGFLDIVMAVSSGSKFDRGIYFYSGDGNGSFTYLKIYRSQEYMPGGIASADFNKDGRMDLVVADSSINVYWNAAALSVLSLNDGVGTVIDNNDNSPAMFNQTDFGQVCLDRKLKYTYYLRNNQGMQMVLSADDISISGMDSENFEIGNISQQNTLGSDSLLAFTISFMPTGEGVKEARVHIVSPDCLDPDYDFAIQGMGVVSNPLTQAVIGRYTPGTVVIGQSLDVIPDAVPENALAIYAIANPVFGGTLVVDPASGILQITNADIPGMYEITLFAAGESACDLVTASFNLEVLSMECSSSGFIATESLHPGDAVQSGTLYQSFIDMNVADFNGDGYNDLAGIRFQEASAIIYLGSETNSFEDSIMVALDDMPYSIQTADMNGDGFMDLALSYGFGTNRHISIELGDGDGNFVQSYKSEKQRFMADLAVGDFNSDGIPDLLVSGSLGIPGLPEYGFKIHFGDGQGGIEKTGITPLDFQPDMLVLGDLNKDGYMDVVTNDNSFLITSAGYNISIRLFHGDGTGILKDAMLLDVHRNPEAIELADIDANGLLDIAVASYVPGDSRVTLYIANEDGSYSRADDLGPHYSLNQMELADFSGDGLVDVLLVNSTNGKILVHPGNGDGTFNEAVSSEMGGQVASLVTADFNNDSILDIALADYWLNSVTIFSGLDCNGSVGVNPITGIEGAGFTVYPNPATTDAYIKWPGEKHINEISLRVYDMTGRIMLDYPNIPSFDGNNTFELDIQNLAVGMFILKIEVNGKLSSKILSKE